MKHELNYILPDKTMTRDEILKRLQQIEADERLFYPTANVFSNAALALIQTSLEVESCTLRRVLNIDPLNFKELRKKK